MYFAQIMQDVYNILPGNRWCDHERRMTKIQDDSGSYLEFRRYENQP